MKAKEEKNVKERRSLIEGLNPAIPVDRTLEEQFVFAHKPRATSLVEPQTPAVAKTEGKGQAANAVPRTPLTIRIRTDYATLLKRASLERQLSGTLPNTLQDILEEALEPWLRSNGYLN